MLNQKTVFKWWIVIGNFILFPRNVVIGSYYKLVFEQSPYNKVTY